MKKRSSEEVEMLECEMANTLLFYKEQRELLLKQIDQLLQTDTPYNRGAADGLHTLLLKVEHLQACKIFPSTDHDSLFTLSNQYGESYESDNDSYCNSDHDLEWILM